MELIRKFKKNVDINSIFLLAVLRDENILIEYFIKYYKKIGITNFIFVDNGSVDGSFEYLKNLDENIMLFSTNKSYKDADYGVKWINTLLQLYCKNHWCLVVDIDELLYINNINSLIDEMKCNNANVCDMFLLDMYSKTVTNYKRGEDFIMHCNYFDKFSNYYINNNKNLFGGVRNRLLNMQCCITKRSFFYNFGTIKLGPGYHNINIIENNSKMIKKYKRKEYLLHFKFIKPDYHLFIEKRIKNNEDWNNSSEYKMLKKVNLSQIYDKEFSVELTNKSQLDKIFKDIVYK
jgi:hypothetical protein